MLNELFDMGLSNKRLKELAASLGADCAFFIDNEPALATGIGDVLTPLGFNPLKGFKLLMIKPDEEVSTAEAYGGIVPRERRTEWYAVGSADNGERRTKNGSLIDAVGRPIEEWKELIVNDFEETVFAKHPRIAEIKEWMYGHGAIYAAMSGSGATVYGVFEKDADIEQLKEIPYGERNFCYSFCY